MDDERHGSSSNDLRELVQAQAVQLERQQAEIDELKRLATSVSAEAGTKRTQKMTRAGLLKAVGMGAVVTVGAATLMEKGTSPALAAKGSFDASGPGIQAVTAVGTNGARGVVGESDSDVAIWGASGTSIGVRGISYGESTQAMGVFGDSISGAGVVGTSSSGPEATGVYGYHTSNTGYGVLGRSFKDASKTDLGVGSGVYGESDYGYGVGGYAFHGTGVSGSSVTGWGVHGICDHGYGGEFQGGKAPLRLVPSSNLGHPTKGKHQRGELVVDAKGNLFLCAATGTPGRWKRVLVG